MASLSLAIICREIIGLRSVNDVVALGRVSACGGVRGSHGAMRQVLVPGIRAILAPLQYAFPSEAIRANVRGAGGETRENTTEPEPQATSSRFLLLRDFPVEAAKSESFIVFAADAGGVCDIQTHLAEPTLPVV